jgi:uncharacterized protein YdeI (YjbR/CyaY-like superfamily)
MSPPALPENAVHPETRARWRAWLARHHARSAGVWLVEWKRATGRPRVTYEAAVEEALCFGWIDSRPRALDAERSLLWFSPRKPRTGWSAPNKARIERLVAAGRMQPAGLARVEAARADGSWQALDAVEALQVPDDLARALAAMPPAAATFAGFPRSAKRGILEWIATAKRADTRARRVEETARLARDGRRANQWPREP